MRSAKGGGLGPLPTLLSICPGPYLVLENFEEALKQVGKMSMKNQLQISSFQIDIIFN